MFADVFEEKESPDKLTYIVEEARVAVGNESSTVPLVLNALFCTSSGSLSVILWWKLSDRLSTMSHAPMCVFQFQYSCLQSKMTLVTRHPILISCAQ